MNKLTAGIALAGIVGAFAGPVFAAAHAVDPETLTCAQFMAMDEDGQMKAFEALEMASMEGATETGDATAEGSDTMMDDEDAMMAMKSACEGHGDMMAMDAMMSDM